MVNEADGRIPLARVNRQQDFARGTAIRLEISGFGVGWRIRGTSIPAITSHRDEIMFHDCDLWPIRASPAEQSAGLRENDIWCHEHRAPGKTAGL